MTAPAERSSILEVPAGVTACLDLNGFTLDGGTPGEEDCVVLVHGSFTLTDSSADGAGRVTGTRDAVDVIGGAFTLSGGTLDACGNFGVAAAEGGKLTMTGGAVRGSGSIGVYVTGEGSTATVSGGEISGSVGYYKDDWFYDGTGVQVDDGAAAEIAGGVISGNVFGAKSVNGSLVFSGGTIRDNTAAFLLASTVYRKYAPCPFSGRNLKYAVLHVLIALGSGRRISKHRHTFASTAVTNGSDIASVSKKPGHPDKAVTLRMYTRADQESMLTPSATSDGTPGFCYYDSGHDNMDNWYDNSIGGFNEDTTNWCEYQIDGAYKTIDGVVYLNYEYRNETANHTKLTIYGDDQMLYTSSVITRGLVPQRFSANIEGVHVLRVCIYGNEYVRLSDCILSVSDSSVIVSSKSASPPFSEERQFMEFSPNLTAYHVIPAISASATSEVLYNGYLYKAGDAIDGDLTTCWQESADGDGIGESLTIYFDRIQTIDALRLRLGYASFYERNGRPKILEFAFSDGTRGQYEFADQNRDYYLRLSTPVQTDYIKLTILDAYSGSVWQDTCITEVTAYQQGSVGSAAISAGQSTYLGYVAPESIVGQYGVQVGAFGPSRYSAAEDFAKQIVESENRLGNTQDVIITIRGNNYVTCLGPFATLDEANYESNLINTEGYQSYTIKFNLN